MGSGEVERPASRSRKAVISWTLRLLGTGVGFASIVWRVELDSLLSALERVSALAFLAACGLTFLNLGVGAVRWRLLLAAYGAPMRPPLLRLARVYWVGFFYNNYLPGGLGGDLVRGIVTRQSFGPHGTAASMTVVLVERALGLVGLLVVVSATSLWRPLSGTDGVLPLSAAGLVLAALGIALVAAGRRLAPRLPGRIGSIAASLPAIEHGMPFLGALSISLVTQLLVALTGWVLVADVTDGALTLGDAMVLVPLAMAAAYFPLSVGGAGVREAAFVALGTNALGLPEGQMVAASLLLWATQLVVAGLGGLTQIMWPLKPAEPPDA